MFRWCDRTLAVTKCSQIRQPLVVSPCFPGATQGFCTIKVAATDNSEHTMCVRTAPLARDKLEIELSDENIQWLLKSHQENEGGTTWEPDLSSFPNVKFLPWRRAIIAKWFDADQKMKERSVVIKSFPKPEQSQAFAEYCADVPEKTRTAKHDAEAHAEWMKKKSK